MGFRAWLARLLLHAANWADHRTVMTFALMCARKAEGRYALSPINPKAGEVEC